MFRFHVSVHALPPGVSSGPSIALDGGNYPTLVGNAAMLATPMSVSFEQAAEALQLLPRMYLEPDGSFVWVSPSGQEPWQVDGNLLDRDGALMLLDLKGTCPPKEFDQLLRAVGWPEKPLMFQLMRQAVFLDDEHFRRYVSAASGTKSSGTA